jgi:hypothetical protein
MMRIDKALTSNQLLNLKASPVQVLPPPGANKFYVLWYALFTVKFVTTHYNNTFPATVTLGLLTPTPIQVDPIGILQSDADIASATFAPTPPPATALTTNQPMLITNEEVNELIDGDSTATLTAFYTIETLP